jgi:hypothetical protein
VVPVNALRTDGLSSDQARITLVCAEIRAELDVGDPRDYVIPMVNYVLTHAQGQNIRSLFINPDMITQLIVNMVDILRDYGSGANGAEAARVLLEKTKDLFGSDSRVLDAVSKASSQLSGF